MDRSNLLAEMRSDFGLPEQVIRAIYTRRVKIGDTVVDGGANNGLHTLPLAEIVGTTGTVIAVEPAPETSTMLTHKVRHLGLSQVRIVQRALSNRGGSVEFSFVRNAPARSGIKETPCPFDVDRELIEVDCVKLDELLIDVSDWRFGKFDLEGGEFHALQGALRSIGNYRPLLIFERSIKATEWYGYTPREFFELFESLNYRVFDLFGEPITEEGWSKGHRPWYAIAVSIGSDDDNFVLKELPSILDSFC